MGIPRSKKNLLTLFQLCFTNLTAEKGEKFFAKLSQSLAENHITVHNDKNIGLRISLT